MDKRRALLSEEARGAAGAFFLFFGCDPLAPDFACYGFKKELFLDSKPALDSDICSAEDFALPETLARDLKLGVRPRTKFCNHKMNLALLYSERLLYSGTIYQILRGTSIASISYNPPP